MAQARRPHQEETVRAAFTLAFLISVSVLPSISVGEVSSKKVLVGSSLPRCYNKCLSCRPCMATLVVSHHQSKSGFIRRSSQISIYHVGDADGYYLQAWKCKCGNKLFQP